MLKKMIYTVCCMASSLCTTLLWADDLSVQAQSKTNTTPGIQKMLPFVRTEQEEKNVSMISMAQLSPFLDQSRVLQTGELEAAPNIVGFEGERLAIAENGRFFVQGAIAEGAREYDILAPGEVLKDKEQQILGIHSRIIGRARLEETGKINVFFLVKSYREVPLGSYLLPTIQHPPQAELILRYPTPSKKGSIVSILDGIDQVGQYHVVIVSGGQDIGRMPGDLLAITRTKIKVPGNLHDQISSETNYPVTRVGTVLIFRVFDKASYALVTETRDFIDLQDTVEGFAS